MSSKHPLLLIGAGNMAVAYAQVLSHLEIPFRCLGRGGTSAARFHEATGICPTTGTLNDQLLSIPKSDTQAIVAVNVAQLEDVCSALLKHGVGNILVEKPGGIDLEAMRRLVELDEAQRIRLAYNRRFLPSARKAAALVAEDGGVQSVHFEFTELADRIAAAAVHPPEVLANWAYANSSHVFDLAFYLAGGSPDLSDVVPSGSASEGHIEWHPKGGRFVGCGHFARHGLFSYFADWESGGGWAIELSTAKRRLRLRPLESLTEQLRGSFNIIDVPFELEPSGLKPGLLGMVQDFLDNNGRQMPKMADQLERMAVFSRLLSGSGKT